jgi:hypothetical protein
MKRSLVRSTIWIIAAGVVLELVLRIVGFGEIPIYKSSPLYDYSMVENQNVNRFGNHLFINSDGMRSEPLGEGEWRVLKFGDSVLNGGVSTDQSELASTILEKRFQHEKSDIRVLNVSAGSWGPDNAFEWMRANGDFDANVIVLVFGSEDWQDQMICRDVVGNVSYYPKEQPVLAISDAFTWVTSRFIADTDWDKLPPTEGCVPNNYLHNSGWDNFIAYSLTNGIPLLVYHHANREENQMGRWNADGEDLEAYLNANNVQIISGLTAGFEESDYRDEVHPNSSGQSKIAEVIYPVLRKIVDDEKQ